MKLIIVVLCLAVSALADVSHLTQPGYVYNVPSPAFELPPAPVKEYLPPATLAPIVQTPGPEYLPPVPAPIIPVAPSNEYLPPSIPEPVPEIISEPIVEPVREYLPPSEVPVVVVPEPVGYTYEAPATRFIF